MKYFLILLVTMTYFSSAQSQEISKKLGDFSKITAGGGFNIILIQSDHNSVKVKTTNMEPEDINFEIKGDNLNIYPKPGGYFNFEVNIELRYKKLTKIDLSGSTVLTCKNELKADNFSIKKSGSSLIRFNDLNVKTLDFESSGSGKAELEGTALSGNLFLSGSGSIDAYSLKMDASKANLKGSGKMELFVQNNLKATVDGKGQILYKGNPKTTVNTNAGGEVRQSSHH